jgi:glycosyltransferase involved in cell wall biosynthesis
MNFAKLDKMIGRFPRLRRNLIKFLEIRKFNEKKIFYEKNSDIDNSLVTLARKNSQGKKLLIDAQCLLTATRERGIGKYTWAIILELSQLRPDLEIVLVAPNIFHTEQIMKLKAKVEKSGFKNLTVEIFDIFGKNSKITLHQAQNSLANAYNQLSASAFLLPSSFEHPRNSLAISLKMDIPIFGIFYDLIPLLHSNSILFSRSRKSLYQWQLQRLLKLDVILSISDFSRKVLEELAPPDKHVRTIWGGPGLEPGLSPNLTQGFDSRRGVLVVGAETPHKNLPTLIQAYSLLPQGLKNEHPLTIVGIRSEGFQIFLNNISKRAGINVVLPNYLTEHQLAETYSNSRLLVVPSITEGLSLPILEAWLYNCVALGGKDTVSEEIIGDAIALCRVTDPVEMSLKIELLLNNEDLWLAAQKSSLKRLELYSWSNSARIVSEELERILGE